MENEILWKWELLCDDFAEAQQNYMDIVSPLINCDGMDRDEIVAQLKKASATWDRWIEIHQQLKKYVEEYT